MNRHATAVAIAKHELGVQEMPPGSHSNTGPRVRLYQAATWLRGTGWPWCVAFWLYCTLRAGLKMPYRGAGAYALLEWARKQGWSVPVTHAVPGDAVIVREGSGHCAMFLELRGGRVYTINGNVSDRVCYSDYPVGMIAGCVHVPEIHAAKAKPKLVEHASSITGHKVRKPLRPWLMWLAGRRNAPGMNPPPISAAELERFERSQK